MDRSLQLLLSEGCIKHAVVVRGDALINCTKDFLLGAKVDRGWGEQSRVKVSSDPKEAGPVRVDRPANALQCADDSVLSSSLLQSGKEFNVGFMQFVFGKSFGAGPITRDLPLLDDPE